MSKRAGTYRAPEGLDIAADLAAKYPGLGDLGGIYAGHEGAVVHKWHHYLPIYERYMSRFRGTSVRMLEIGVAQGGSLEMWRRWLGPEAVIYGIDIRDKCARFNGVHGQVRIGSQDDPEFLARVVDEMGGVDLVLDDGSHEMAHIEASLRALFPRLSNGGVYLIEDLHSAYWTRWGGGLAAKANFFNSLRDLVDDMHHWYHEGEVTRPMVAQGLAGIHIHDSFVVLDKDMVYEPIHTFVGNPDNDRAATRKASKVQKGEER